MKARTEAILLAGVFLTGVATAILGAALPVLQLRYAVSDAELGRLFAAQFAGSALAATASQRHPRFSLVMGFQLIAIGAAAAAFAPWHYAAISVFIYGVGLGFSIPAANMAIAHARQATRGASLNILNLAWGVGAAATPLLLLAATTTRALATVYLAMATCAEVVAILLLLFLEKPAPAPISDRIVAGGFDPAILLHALRFLLYVGAESCVGGWTAEYVFRTFGGQRLATLAIAGFWIALLAGRAVAPALLRRWREPVLLRASLTAAVLGVVAMFLAPSALMVVAASCLAGLGMAPVFALQLSVATAYAEALHRKIPGWLFTCAAIGGVSMPWAFGELAQRTLSLRNGLLLPIVALLVLLTLNLRQTTGLRQDTPSGAR